MLEVNVVKKKTKEEELMSRALMLYGRCVLSTVLGLFMWISIGIIASAMIPDGEVISPAGEFVQNLVALIVAGFLYSTIVCSESWRRGDKDGAEVVFGGKTGDPLFGLKVAAVSVIPSVVAYVLLIVDKAVGLWSGYLSAYRLMNGTLYSVMNWTLGKNLQTTIGQVSWGGVILSGLPIVITLGMAFVSYYIGYKQVPLAKRLMYKGERK